MPRSSFGFRDLGMGFDTTDTGQMGEYWVAAAIMAMCVGVGILTKSWDRAGYSPFFYDWGKYYSNGLIDGAEWKANRFRWL